MTPACFAKKIDFHISVDKTGVSLGDSLQLELTFYGAQDVSAPELPELEGFKAHYLGASRSMSIVNGRSTSSTTHMFILYPVEIGTFQIGPFHKGYGGQVYTSNSATVTVFKGRVAASPLPSVKSIKRLTSGHPQKMPDRVFLVMEAGKDTAYVNEDIPVKIKLYANEVGISRVQYPEFSHQSFSAEAFGKPRQNAQVTRGLMYDVLEFNTTVYGLRPGDFVLGPAKIKGVLEVPVDSGGRARRDPFDDPFFRSFFRRVDTYPMQLESNPVPVKILPLPGAGKPRGFRGAVGNFTVDAFVHPTKVKAGDPITLKITVSGNGNFNTVNAPELEPQDNFKVYEAKVIKQERGTKVFEQVLIPKKAGITTAPKIRFSFFSPDSNAYRTAEKGPFRIEVTKPDDEAKLKLIEMPGFGVSPVAKEIFGRDIVHIKESPGGVVKKDDYLYRKTWFRILQIFPAIFLMAVIVVRRRSDRLKKDIRYARKIRASKNARRGIRNVKRLLGSQTGEKFYYAVFKTTQDYLGNKFHLASAGITADIAEGALKSANVSEEIIAKVKEVFADCDMARYAPSEVNKEAMLKTFKNFVDMIEHMEKVKV